jgi:hypothetical protein
MIGGADHGLVVALGEDSLHGHVGGAEGGEGARFAQDVVGGGGDRSRGGGAVPDDRFGRADGYN